MQRDLIVIGASAGGVEALTRLVSGLPRNLGAPVCVVLHLPAGARSMLPVILGRHSPLSAVAASDGARLEPGVVYTAPSDWHMTVQDGLIRLSRGPRENYSRPAIDPLFRSAALEYGPRAIGVVLSGTLSDGVAGLRAIKAEGGLAVVQDPHDALFAEMPSRASAQVEVDGVAPAAELGALLGELLQDPIPEDVLELRRQRERDRAGRAPAAQHGEVEMDVIDAGTGGGSTQDYPGRPSVFGCPECGGVLWELEDGEMIRFRCRIGHAYSSDALITGERQSIENALWVAIRALEEHADLHERLASRSQERGLERSTEQYRTRAADARVQARVIRRAIMRGDPSVDSGVQLNVAGADAAQT